MEPDFRDLLQRLVDQIDFDFDTGEDISQDLWDLKVEAKKALQ